MILVITNTTGLVNGKILKYDASSTSWVIADDSGGSGGGGGNVAVGSIMIWSGATNQIPTGWQLHAMVLMDHQI